MKTINLTNSSLEAFVDDQDYDKVAAYVSWSANGGGYPTSRIAGGTITMHEVVMGKAPLGLEWDHRDRNRLNNQKANLRLATIYQNRANVGVRSSNSTGYKGVSFDTMIPERPYLTRIRVNGKRLYLGRFATAEEAARVYDEAAIKYFGEFACLNLPTPQSSPAE